MKKLGSRIRTLRINEGLDIADLSLEIGLTGAQISRIETSVSDITLSSIIRIAYGLNLSLQDVLAELEIRAFFPRLIDNGVTDRSSEIVTIQDVEAFLEYYRDEPGQAKDLLISAYHVVRENGPNWQEEKPSDRDTAEIIWEATQAHSNKFLPIPYPKGFKEEVIEEIYRKGGVITIRDLAGYILACRRSSGQSLRKLAESTDVSFNSIARLERGEIERISFTEIISIDKALNLDGRMIAVSWAAGEFNLGISRIKAMADQTPLPSSGWAPEELAFADTLITITRWNSVLSVNDGWLEKLRNDNLSYYY